MAPRAGPTLWTFGDSILDSGRYNSYGLHAAALVLRNADDLFPEFRGRDLATRVEGWRLAHRAVDGATVATLPRQVAGARPAPGDVALVTVGGNDLLNGLVEDEADGIERFGDALDRFLADLAPARVLLGNVYDPTFGDDRRNFLQVDPPLARRNLARMNDTLARLARAHGALIDVHGHFLRGEPTWFTGVIEPSMKGTSEVRRVFLAPLLAR